MTTKFKSGQRVEAKLWNDDHGQCVTRATGTIGPIREDDITGHYVVGVVFDQNVCALGFAGHDLDGATTRGRGLWFWTKDDPGMIYSTERLTIVNDDDDSSEVPPRYRVKVAPAMEISRDRHDIYASELDEILNSMDRQGYLLITSPEAISPGSTLLFEHSAARV